MVWLQDLHLDGLYPYHSLSNDEKIFALFMVLSLFMLINTFLIIKGNYFLGDLVLYFLGCLIGLSTIYIYNTHSGQGTLLL